MKSILRHNTFGKDTKELLKDTIVFAIGTIGSKLILFFLVPLYSSVLAAEEYGNADLIVSSMSLIYPLFSLGIEQSIIRFGLTNRNIRSNVLKTSINITILGGFLFSAIIIITNLLYPIPYLFFSVLLYFTSSLSHILASYAKIEEKNKVYAINAIIKATSLCLCNILFLVVLRLGIIGYLLSVIIHNIISVLFLSVSCHVMASYHSGIINTALKTDMLRYSLPLVPNTISWWVTQLSDRYLVKYISGDYINGLYSMAYKIPSVFNLIVSIFSQAFSLSVFKQIDREGDNNFSQIYRYYVSISFISGSFIILLSRLLAKVLLRKVFYQSWPFIPILIFAYVIGNLQAYYGNLFAGLKQSKNVFKTTLLGAIINIVLNLLLIPRYNAYGAAIATAISYIVIYYSRYFIIRKMIVFDHQTKRIALCIMILLIQVVLYEIDNPISLICSILLLLPFIFIFKEETKTLVKRVIRKQI